MSLFPNNKSGDSFNFYLQKSIAWWEPSLKDGFHSISQTFHRAAILWWVDQKFKLLADISFESCLQNIALSSLQLFSCASYWVDLDDIQWNEVATSTAHNFNNSRPLYLIFSNMINLCPNIWFIKNSNVSNFYFEKGAAKKAQIFHIFTGSLFCNGWPNWHECSRILRKFCGLSKEFGFATFPEI